jgi:hypothetical protein
MDQSNVIKKKTDNKSSVSNTYTNKHGGGKFDAGSTQGTGYQRTDKADKAC